MELPKLPESGGEKNELIASLARLAKDVVGGVRKHADEKLGEHEKHNAKVMDGLEGIAQAFDTDPEAALTPYEMEAKQVSAVVNFIRSMFGYEPLKEGEKVDLSKDLKVEKGKAPSLDLGGKKVRFDQLKFSGIKDEGERVVQAALSSITMKDNLSGKHCWDWVNKIYKAAGIEPGEVLFAVDHYGAKGTFEEKMLIPGAWIYYHNSNTSDKYGDHSGILQSFNEETGMAWMLSFPGPGKLPRRHEVNLREMPVQRVQVPKKSESIA